MFSRVYRLLLIVSWTLLGLGLVVSLALPSGWATFGAVVTGLAASLLASTYIQSFASMEQSTLLRELTLSIDGVAPLPKDFALLRWVAYTTRVSDGTGGKKVQWSVAPIQRVQTSGSALAKYELDIQAPGGKRSSYSFTFVGLTGCVFAVAAKGSGQSEKVSIAIYDVSVEDAGTYFGVGYLTDWLGERALSLEIVGVTKVPSDFEDLPSDVRARHKRWLDRVDWSVAPSTGSTQA